MRYLYFVGAALLLASCDQKNTYRQETVAVAPTVAPAVVVPPRRLALADTASPYTILPSANGDAPAASTVRIKGNAYQVEATAVADSTQPVHYTPADTTQSNTANGVEGIYTFRLLRPDGKPLFVRQLKKSDFAAEMGPDLTVASVPVAPVFSGYLPEFNALAFELSFYFPDSDDGGELLLLLDATTGKVKHQAVARWMGGCNSSTVLSKDGRTLLTSTEIVQANGRALKLDKPGRSVAGTLLVNDKTVLVVYESGYDKKGRSISLKGPNALLMDLNGRQLAAFDLESTDGGLGSTMASTYIAQTRTHYLFDESNNRLGLVQPDQPSRMRVVKCNQLPSFHAPQQPAEVRIVFDTETGTHAAFYVDTVSGQIRQSVHKPTY